MKQINNYESLVDCLRYRYRNDLFFIKLRFNDFLNNKQIYEFKNGLMCLGSSVRMALADVLGVSPLTVLYWIDSNTLYYPISEPNAIRISNLIIKAIDEATKFQNANKL